MKAVSAKFGLRSEFDNFLFASIGEDRSGLPLSCLSALARLDIDPWEEATRLASLPADAAAQRIAVLLGRLPDWFVQKPDPRKEAARLGAATSASETC